MVTTDRPVLFAFHGRPSLVHRLAYRRTTQSPPEFPGRTPRPRRLSTR
ncbi:hypothetical protein [Ornithinimicrobium sp. Y1694]